MSGSIWTLGWNLGSSFTAKKAPWFCLSLFVATSTMRKVHNACEVSTGSFEGMLPTRPCASKWTAFPYSRAMWESGYELGFLGCLGVKRWRPGLYRINGWGVIQKQDYYPVSLSLALYGLIPIQHPGIITILIKNLGHDFLSFSPSLEIKGRSKKLRPILDIFENTVEKEEPRLSPAPKNLFLFHVQIKCVRITILFDVMYVILYLIFTSEFSKAKSCIRQLLNEECPTNKNSSTLHMNLIFDGYNPFCINRIYQPPTTVTTPFRIQEQNTKLPKEEERKTPQRNTLTTSSTSCKKLNLHIYFKILLVLLSADYV